MMTTNDDREAKEWLEGWDDGDHDVDAMRADIASNNLDVGDDQRAAEYEHTVIVRDSLVNGQFEQAKEQCRKYGLSYGTQHRIFEQDNSF